jgi:GTP cyclohydrolase II
MLEKVAGLSQCGVVITNREPVLVSSTSWSADYLETKRARMGHRLPAVPAPPPDAE